MKMGRYDHLFVSICGLFVLSLSLSLSLSLTHTHTHTQVSRHVGRELAGIKYTPLFDYFVAAKVWPQFDHDLTTSTTF